MRRLIVNADDFGLTPGVNEGIVDAYRRGILRSTTLMANGPAFGDAVERARTEPGLDIGAHLTLVGGESVAEPGRRLPETVPALLLARPSPAALEREIEAQVEKILAAGVRISHLDTHKHTHLWPRVLEAVIRSARRHAIVWIRRPFDLPLTAASARAPRKRRAVSRCLGWLQAGFERRLDRAGLCATDYFAGFQVTGDYSARELAALIEALPDGTTEFMCHPGRCDAELRASRSRLKGSRERELAALTSAEAPAAAERAGVKLCGFSELSELEP